MRTIAMILTAMMINGCGLSILHDDVSPEEARSMTTTDLQYIYGSYRYNKDMLPNITNELAMRGKL